MRRARSAGQGMRKSGVMGWMGTVSIASAKHLPEPQVRKRFEVPLQRKAHLPPGIGKCIPTLSQIQQAQFVATAAFGTRNQASIHSFAESSRHHRPRKYLSPLKSAIAVFWKGVYGHPFGRNV